MRYDYSSIGFYTFDCLGWPVTAIPEGGGTFFIEELTLAVSGAAGTAVIAAAKMGLNCLAVGGVGQDSWVTGCSSALLASVWTFPECSKSPDRRRPRRSSAFGRTGLVRPFT